jgi:hypothetical protein
VAEAVAGYYARQRERGAAAADAVESDAAALLSLRPLATDEGPVARRLQARLRMEGFNDVAEEFAGLIEVVPSPPMHAARPPPLSLVRALTLRAD